VKAIVERGGKLAWDDVPTPVPGPGEVRIRVRATAVNRADLVQRAGFYPPPPGASPILGLEAAGEVDAVGAGVDFAVGDAVCALLAGGGYAEHVVVPAGQVLPIPSGMTAIEAAALPEALCTAHLNLVGEAGLVAGERVLLHAGASGVGTAAIQLCRVLGAPVWVTVGSRAKLESCVGLGAEGGADRHAGPWVAHADGWTQGHGFDVILDPVGGGYVEDDLRALATGGRLVLIGLMGGRTASIDLGRMLVKRLRLIGSTLRSRTVGEKSRIVARLRTEIWPHVAAGRIRPMVDTVLPLPDVEQAHVLVAKDANFGKVVLTVP
jgi:putative PIG3 family NAD(P)H quinone oxidoreductase